MAAMVLGPAMLHVIFPLEHFHHSPVDNLGIQTFERQKHDGEFRSIRRSDIFVTYGFCLGADGCCQRSGTLTDLFRITGLISVPQFSVGFPRKF